MKTCYQHGPYSGEFCPGCVAGWEFDAREEAKQEREEGLLRDKQRILKHDRDARAEQLKQKETSRIKNELHSDIKTIAFDNVDNTDKARGKLTILVKSNMFRNNFEYAFSLLKEFNIDDVYNKIIKEEAAVISKKYTLPSDLRPFVQALIEFEKQADYGSVYETHYYTTLVKHLIKREDISMDDFVKYLASDYAEGAVAAKSRAEVIRKSFEILEKTEPLNSLEKDKISQLSKYLDHECQKDILRRVSGENNLIMLGLRGLLENKDEIFHWYYLCYCQYMRIRSLAVAARDSSSRIRLSIVGWDESILRKLLYFPDEDLPDR